jgi:hypothetical protein
LAALTLQHALPSAAGTVGTVLPPLLFIVFPAGRHFGFHSAAHQLVGIWTTAKCIAMLFAHQLMRMKLKMAAG